MFSCYSFQPSRFQPLSSTKSSSSEFYFKLIKWKHFPALYNYICKNFLCNKETNISAILEESLSFPHSFLDEIWSCYRAFQDYPNSSAAFEKYKRSKELYQRITEVENDPKAWFNCLLEVGDDEFVIQNVENRIVELD
uniref:Uncharacterized protein n=1 Tax=Panagrolaimus davidi TaxID=227884 RepID=A0A914R0L2_9BILA